MKSYNTEWIRNVGIVGHGDTGKTQLVSSLLFTAGMTPRLGKVTDGSTVTDWDEEEIARKISINTRPRLCRMAGARPGGKNKNQFARYAGLFDLHQRNEILADRRRCVADRGGRGRGRAGGHRKSVGLRDRIRPAARVPAELDGPRTGELRARARVASARVRARRCADPAADRLGEEAFAAWWIWSR